MDNISKVIQWILARYKSLSKVGKGLSVAGLCAILIAMLLCCGCGTIGWISSKDTSSATISIQNSPSTNTNLNPNINLNGNN